MVAVSVPAVLVNVLSIIVFTNPHMRASSISRMFAVLACVHLVPFLSMFPFNIYLHIIDSPCKSKAGQQIMYAILLIAWLGNSIDTWLIVTIAVERFVTISRQHKSLHFKRKQVKYTVLGVFLWSFFMTLPYFFLYGVRQRPGIHSHCYDIDLTDLATSHTIESNLLFATLGGVGYFLPQVILTVFTCLIVHNIRSAIRRRATMTRYIPVSQLREQTRSTSILLALMVMDILAEIPHGILIFLNAYLEHFYYNVFVHLRHFLAMVSFTSKTLNFLVYYNLSRSFRETLKSYIFVQCARDERHPRMNMSLRGTTASTPIPRLVMTENEI